MLTFKKGKSYSKYELHVLYDVISDAERAIHEKAGCHECHACNCHECHACNCHRPCQDLANLLEYIYSLIFGRGIKR